jgi:hypothetical protein
MGYSLAEFAHKWMGWVPVDTILMSMSIPGTGIEFCISIQSFNTDITFVVLDKDNLSEVSTLIPALVSNLNEFQYLSPSSAYF